MDTTSAPLADYFWIAGIDSLSYHDPVYYPSNTNNTVGPPSPQVDATIEEGDGEGEASGSVPQKENGNPKATARHSRTNSWNRLSKIGNDPRNSVEVDNTQSNRSSITIKGPSTNGNGNGNGGGMLGDFDFDTALLKFASERETFLDDLSFSAGAPVQSRPPMTNPKAERLKVEDSDAHGPPGRRSPLRSVGGSIRRRISFRDMSSMKRQPSNLGRSSEWSYFSSIF